MTGIRALATFTGTIEMHQPRANRLRTVKRDRTFQHCAVEDGDEVFPNGIFEFNITRLLEFVNAHADRFPGKRVAVADILELVRYNLDEATVRDADLSRPILMAEIAPGRYNVIDGHHRLARAWRKNVARILVRRVRCPEHVDFLTWIGRAMDVKRDVSRFCGVVLGFLWSAGIFLFLLAGGA